MKPGFDRLLSCRCGTYSRLTGWRRKPEFELETGRVIKHFDPRAMKTGDGSDQTEPEAISRRVATVFEPVKALKNLVVSVGGNSGPVIGDRDHRPAFNDFVRDNDLATCAAMLDRIVHEIGDGIKNQIAIAGHQHLTIADNSETGALLFGRGIVQLDHLAGDFDQVHGAERALSRLGSICAIRVIDENIRKTASRSAIVSPISD